MRRLLASAGSAALISGALWACTSNHDVLAVHPSTGGTGGVVPDASGGTGGGSGAPDAAPDVTEPPGPDELTLLHGVVDAKRITFCFARVQGGASQAAGSPVPAAGLDYAHATSVASLPGLDFKNDAIQPIVIAGDLSLVSGMQCDAALALAAKLAPPDAGADAAADAGLDAASDAAADVVDAAPPEEPALRAQALPVLPAGTLSGGRSFLLVAAGCMGAPGFSDALDQGVCGDGYAPDQPTLAPVVVHMSRLAVADHLGLQAVHASRGTDVITLRSGTPPNTTHNPLPIASNVTFGAILPRPPLFDQPLVAYGTPLGTVPLEVFSGSSAPVFSPTWADAMALGGVSKLEDGRTYALVLVGPRADIATPGWWNPPAITLLSTAP